MSTSLAPVPPGENPFLFYRTTLRAVKPVPPDKTGLKIRLVLLLVLLGFAFFASLANLATHLYSTRLKGRSFWLFRLVTRQGGTHIISNHFVLSGLVGVACAPVLIANVYFAWSVFPGDGSGIEKMLILQFSALPIAYFFGWLLSWATFQSFLQVEGGRHRSRFTVPAWVETTAYIGGLIVLVGILVGLMVPAALANNKQWQTFDACLAFFETAASGWDGSPLSADVLRDVAKRLADVESTAEQFSFAARRLAIAGAILPAILLLINGGMWFFVHTIRKQVSFQLHKLTGVQISTIDTSPASPSSDIGRAPSLHSEIDSKSEKQRHQRPRPYPAPSSSDHLPTFIPLKVLPATNPFRKTPLDFPPSSPTMPPPAIHFVETFKKNRDRADSSAPRPLTRGKIHALSKNPDRLARDQAERLMLMMRAEQELLTLSSSTFFIAAGLTIWCGWAIGTLDSNVSRTWADNEALYLAPIWVYSVGLAASESLHAWIEWRHLAPWRAARARSRSLSNGNGSRTGTSPANGRGVAILPISGNGIATAVQVDVQVVTRHEAVEVDEEEKRFGDGGYGRRGHAEALGVALTGHDGKDRGEEESYEEEKVGRGADA